MERHCHCDGRHSGKPLWQVAGKGPREPGDAAVCISPNGRQYATAVYSDRLYTWDAMQGIPAYDYGPIPGANELHGPTMAG